MTYDGHDRQMRWIFPSKTTPGVADQGDYEHYQYDPNGNRTLLRKRDEWVMTFQYDALDRMTAKLIPERHGLTAAQTRDVHYAYDLRGLQTEVRFDGLSGEGVSNVYDGFGRLTSTRTSMGGASRTIAHRYDRDGAEVETTFPDGERFWISRDGLGRMGGSYHGALGDTSTGMTVFYYSWNTDLYYFGRRWGSATFYGTDLAGRLTRLDQYFNTAPEPGRAARRKWGLRFRSSTSRSGQAAMAAHIIHFGYPLRIKYLTADRLTGIGFATYRLRTFQGVDSTWSGGAPGCSWQRRCSR